jgi:hypothetical protein
MAVPVKETTTLQAMATLQTDSDVANVGVSTSDAEVANESFRREWPFHIA